MQNDWQDGDEIISTPITFVSTNLAIVYENLKPVFADVDEYLCMDPEDVEKKITERTKAVIFVGYGGRVGQLDKIIEQCLNDAEFEEGRKTARKETWAYIGESAVRTTDYLIRKRDELLSSGHQSETA